MPQEWSNWSGSLRFTPAAIVRPPSEKALAELVCQAAEQKRTVRVVGVGHSSSPLVETSDTLVSLSAWRAVEADVGGNGEATLAAGATLHQSGEALLSRGMAFTNLGDIDDQTVAGAFATGTHGTGVHLPILSTHLIGGRLVTGTGEIVSFSRDQDPDFVRAARVSLGALGIITTLRLRLVPAYRIRKREWCAGIADCVAHFDRLTAAHRNVDFYWYPRSDEAKIRTIDLAEDDPAELRFARLREEKIGWSNTVIPNVRELRFEEMEYAVPIAAGLECFQEVRQRIKERWRRIVGWRVLYRTIAADDAHLSMAYERPTAAISLHQNATLPFREFFADVEPIFRAYGGRPHWGKQHSLRAADLRPLYPAWDDFLEIRRQMDPAGVFLNAYLRELLGVG